MNDNFFNKNFPHIEQLFMAHLINFDSPVNHIRTPYFDIKFYYSDELSELFEIESSIVQEGFFLVIKEPYHKEKELEKQDPFASWGQFYSIVETPRIFLKPLLVLNLFKKNRAPLVIGRSYFKRNDIDERIVAKKITDPRSSFSRVLELDENGNEVPIKYFLSSGELPNIGSFTKTVLDFISNTVSNDNMSFLKIAINFFEDGIKKEVNRDFDIFTMRIIDYVIGLEALYLKREKAKSITLANRVSRLLSKNNPEKMELFEYVKKLYKLRNKLVHGSLPKLKISGELSLLEKGNPTGFQCSVRELLRRSIVHFLSLSLQGHTKPKTLKLLDKAPHDKRVETEIAFAKNKLFF